MPSETFFNLHREKKGRVYRAALNEFARVPFEEVSIKNIVQSAGIPRGSFYQYFENKEDLFRYIIISIRHNAGGGSGSAPVIDPGKDIFENLLQNAEQAIDELVSDGGSSSYRARIIRNMSKSQIAALVFDQEISRGFQENDEFMGCLRKSIQHTPGKEQVAGLIELLIYSFKSALLSVLLQGKSKEDALSALRRKLNIIQNGTH